jgi:hypothetical protein
MSEDRKYVERVYIFPKEEIIKRKSLSVSKDNLRGPYWYDQYRVDEKPYNEIYQNIRRGINNGNL